MSEALEKYGLGMVGAALVAGLATVCLYWGVAYLPKLPLLPGRIKITGQSGVFVNLAYIAMAGFLFSRFFLGNVLRSDAGEIVVRLCQTVTLVLFIVIFALALSGLVLPGL